jgi:hypothetical protein
MLKSRCETRIKRYNSSFGKDLGEHFILKLSWIQDRLSYSEPEHAGLCDVDNGLVSILQRQYVSAARISFQLLHIRHHAEARSSSPYLLGFNRAILHM